MKRSGKVNIGFSDLNEPGQAILNSLLTNYPKEKSPQLRAFLIPILTQSG